MNLVCIDIDGTLIEEGFGVKENLQIYSQMISRVKNYIDSGWAVLFLTGRPEEYEQETAKLLFNLGFVGNDQSYLMLRPSSVLLEQIPDWKTLMLVQHWQHFKPEEIHIYDNELPNLISMEKAFNGMPNVKMWLVTEGKADIYS